jgi:hypothetical protein
MDKVELSSVRLIGGISSVLDKLISLLMAHPLLRANSNHIIRSFHARAIN